MFEFTDTKIKLRDAIGIYYKQYFKFDNKDMYNNKTIEIYNQLQ